LRAQQPGPQASSAQTSPAQQPTEKSQSSSATVPESSGKVSVETKMVTLYATVRDKHGKIVPTLNKENFALAEDEHPQTISYFVRETDLPLTLGLLVDTSMSQANVLDNERTASFTFLDHMMRDDKDHAFVIHFDHDVELLQDVTPSKPKLQAALQLLSTSQSDSSQSQSGGGQRRGSGGSGTHLYDAIYLASHDVISTQKGRKAIFVLTDGVDRGSKETLEEAIEAAQRPTRRSTRSTSRAQSRPLGAALATVAEWDAAADIPAVMAEAAIRRKSMSTERKFSKSYRPKPAVSSSKLPKSSRSIKPTPKPKKNSAISTASATRRLRPTLTAAIIASSSPSTRRTIPCRRATDIIRIKPPLYCAAAFSISANCPHAAITSCPRE
jgi:hypothetical protein